MTGDWRISTAGHLVAEVLRLRAAFDAATAHERARCADLADAEAEAMRARGSLDANRVVMLAVKIRSGA